MNQQPRSFQVLTPSINTPVNSKNAFLSTSDAESSKRSGMRPDAFQASPNLNMIQSGKHINFNNLDIPLQGLDQTFISIMVGALSSILNQIKELLSQELLFIQQNANEIKNFHKNTPIQSPRLRTLKYLLNFNCFTIYTRRMHPDYTKYEAIVERFTKLISIIEEMICILEKENADRTLLFFEESECYKCFLKIFSSSLFQKELFRKLCSEIWRYLRNVNSTANSNSKNAKLSPNQLQTMHLTLLYERVKLYLFGICLPTSDPRDYPLHQAIYDSNIPLVRKLCSRTPQSVFFTHIEEADPSGNTPLMLAVKLNRKEIVLILADHGADPKHRVLPNSKTPLEAAVAAGQRTIVRTLVIAFHHQMLLKWQNNSSKILALLESMPDFTFEIHWECDSKFIPLVKTLTPNDTYKLYKRGSFLRIDMSLIGWSKVRALKGNVSIILQGRGNREGEILVVDNITKTVSSLLKDINLTQLDKEVDDLLNQGQYTSELKAENVSLNLVKNWRGDSVAQKIENYNTLKYLVKGTFHLTVNKALKHTKIDFEKANSFKEYFAMCLDNRHWISEEELLVRGRSREVLTESIISYMESNPDTMNLLFGESNQRKTPDNSTLFSPSSKVKTEKTQPDEKANVKHYKKNISATVWLCDNFPLTLEHLLPMLDLLSSANPKVNRIREFFEKKSLIQKNSFPLKAVIPIFLSVNAIISFQNFVFKTPDAALFDIDRLTSKTGFERFDISIPSDERVKTEGYADDIDSPLKYKKKWEELLRNDCDSPSRGGKNDESDFGMTNFSPTRRGYAPSAFGKAKTRVLDSDYVNIFEEDQRDYEMDEDQEFSDLSEKFRDETLKVNSHPTTNPKMITSIVEKFSTKTTQMNQPLMKASALDFQSMRHSVMPNMSYFKDSNSTTHLPSNDSERESIVLPEVTANDQQMRKIQKYTSKKHTMLSKGDISQFGFPAEIRLNSKEDGAIGLLKWRRNNPK